MFVFAVQVLAEECCALVQTGKAVPRRLLPATVNQKVPGQGPIKPAAEILPFHPVSSKLTWVTRFISEGTGL